MARTRNVENFEKKRQKILRAAEALFIERGFHQTGMAAICDAAGMSPGALYRYFPSKTDIIRAIVEEERNDTLSMLDNIEMAGDVRVAMAEIVEEIILEASNPDYAAMAFEISAEATRDETIGEMLKDSESQAHQRITSILETAQQHGQISPETDAKSAAAFLLAIMSGSIGETGKIIAALPIAHRKATINNIIAGIIPPMTARP